MEQSAVPDGKDHRGVTSRRSFVKIGAIGFLGLSLSLTDLFRLQAAAADGANGAKAKSNRYII